MKKTLLALFAAFALLSSCKKSVDGGCDYDACATVAAQNEISAVQSYLTQNSISGALQHCSGAFYKILDPGTGNSANACSKVNVTYRGTFTSGYEFDRGTIDIGLDGVIKGWRNLVPLVKSGGHIMLYIPPSLGYGMFDQPGVPGNSILIFDVTLNSVQ
ncbi:MAG: FKBP-type peptidylprolyl isomerase [Chitinophagaceae bacterium]|nr:MAG: FKBP-type peptidylprolyl isomerase [Chitinophagaceae bacterium]